MVSIVGILATGMTFVILTRGIDLSVGSILGIAVVLFAGSMDSRGMALAIPIGLGAAALAGLINGIGIAYAGLPAFIMTLGMLSFVRGLAFIYTGGTPVPILSEDFYALGNGYLLGIPIPALILLAALLVSGFILGLTPFGSLRLRHRVERGSGAAFGRARAALQDHRLRHLRPDVGARRSRLRVPAQHRHADRRPGLRTRRYRRGGGGRNFSVRWPGVGRRHIHRHAHHRRVGQHPQSHRGSIPSCSNSSREH